jgi:crossover junction endodeoxyribonuclease RuvC
LPSVAGRIDGCNLARRLRALAPGLAIVEAVGPMPKQGIASTSKFMRAAGNIEGVLEALEIPIRLVTATTWKRYFRVGTDKEKSRALALQRFPECADNFSRKKDHNRAEAALLALYGYELRIGQKT